MTTSVILFFILGLGLLVAGAELLVRGASHLAVLAGISPLVVGLTVVAFGTSAPELVVSITSTLAGQSDLAFGNVVGSNIFNVLFILGLCAIITPLAVARQLVKFDLWAMVGVSLVLVLLARDFMVSRTDGIILVVLFAGITIWTLRLGMKEAADGAEASGTASAKFSAAALFRNLVLIVIGLGLLVLGSRWLVDSAVSVARALEISELIVGLTIVAAGTSLPEVATSVMAGIRGHRDIAVGNVVGSNIFNIVCVLGIASIVSPAGIPVAEGAYYFDLMFMAAVAIACLPIFFTGLEVARWEGAVFLFYYVAYTVYLILSATGHEALQPFSLAMIVFVVPLTVLVLLRSLLKTVRRKFT